jgi:glyoxylase-like metal-dependent hydrolase (beta-lactamase superfamily II)
VLELSDLDVACLRAANPGPYTLSGTNTWVLGRDPAWVIDPGPALPEHIEAIASEVQARGGAGGIAITHDHGDHVEGVPALRERLGGPPVAALRYPADVVLGDGHSFGPLEVVAIPGHAPDHLAFVAGAVCFSGDAVLGEGSVFVAEALGDYLAALERLRELPLAVICPGHGPPVWTPREKLDQYLAHRRERERRLIAALEDGLYERDELLDAVWDDAPAALRPAAAITLAAHLQKLREEGRLPPPVDAEQGQAPR